MGKRICLGFNSKKDKHASTYTYNGGEGSDIRIKGGFDGRPVISFVRTFISLAAIGFLFGI